MKALVTGAAGFIGAHVVQALAGRGVEIVAADRPGASWPDDAGRGGTTTKVEADLFVAGTALELARNHRPDLLVHLAWYARPHDYLTSRENLRSLAATNALVAALIDAGCRRIFGVGTCLEYAASGRPHREDDQTAPGEIYSTCKHAARLVGERLALDQGVSFAWARVFHLHGPGENPERLIPMVEGKLRRGETVDLSPGDQVRDYLRVEDVGDAIAAAAVSDVAGTVNVCSGSAHSLREILLAVGQALGRPELLRFGAIPYRPGDRMCVAGVPESLRRIGWAPRHSPLREALRYLAG
jgi:nucleoside-diphosphate-sugar epimerase